MAQQFTEAVMEALQKAFDLAKLATAVLEGQIHSDKTVELTLAKKPSGEAEVVFSKKG